MESTFSVLFLHGLFVYFVQWLLLLVFWQTGKKIFPVHLLCIIWDFTSFIYIIRDVFSKLKNSIPCLTVLLLPTCAPTWSGALICSGTSSYESAIKYLHFQVLLPAHVLCTCDYLCRHLHVYVHAFEHHHVCSPPYVHPSRNMPCAVSEYCFCHEGREIVWFDRYFCHRCWGKRLSLWLLPHALIPLIT